MEAYLACAQGQGQWSGAADTRRRWTAAGGVEVVASPSNKCNGTTLCMNGNQIHCEHSTSSVVVWKDGAREVIVSHYGDKELNSPNDVVVTSDGAIWFTDPPYGRWPGFGVEREAELDFCGVYRWTKDGGLQLVVDAKAPNEAYREAANAADEAVRSARLAEHAAKVRSHIDALGAKNYWEQFQPSPEFVVLFLPGDQFLAGALQSDPGLIDRAIAKKVLLATPTNLIAIARTVAAVWRQEKLASEARAIGALGKELYDRLAKAGEDLRKVGSGLTTAVNNYNSFVSSFESRALVSARKFRELNIEPGAREIGVAEPVEALARYGDDVLRLPDAAE